MSLTGEEVAKVEDGVGSTEEEETAIDPKNCCDIMGTRASENIVASPVFL